MTSAHVQTLRLALAAIGVMIWAWGYRSDDQTIRWVAIIVIAVAVLLRFAAPRKRPDVTPE